MLRCKYIPYALRMLWCWLTIYSFLGILSQCALSVDEEYDYWSDHLLIPSSTRNSISLNLNKGKITDSKPIGYTSISGSTDKAYRRLDSTSNGFDQKLMYILDSLEALDISSLKLQIGETVFCSPSFNSYRSAGLRLYSTSVDWQDPQHPEPVKLVLSVHRARDIPQRKDVPSVMIIMYSESVPTRERTLIGYGRYGIYATLTLLWEDSGGFPGTSFFQFGVAHDNRNQFQPFYDPDLKELMYLHRGQWVAAGWRISDPHSLQSVVKYLYYALTGRSEYY
jgi:hypothetical protein